MRKNFTSKLIVWLGWSVIWIWMKKILYSGGLVYGKTLFQLLVECFLSVLAAEMMSWVLSPLLYSIEVDQD